MLPALVAGDALTITMSSTTFQPRILVYECCGGSLAAQVAAAGSATSVTLNYVQQGSNARIMDVFLTSVAPLTIGNFHLTLNGTIH
jgi:hypothetical protein